MPFYLYWIVIVLAVVSCGGSGGDTSPPSTPEPEADDRVRSQLYPEDWVPGYSVSHPDYMEPLLLQDYSYAGYHHGEKPIPDISANIIEVVAATDGSMDASEAIQKAIDRAVAGNGGVVYLPAGLYRIDRPLRIQGSNIVLRGAGADKTKLWFYRGGGTSADHKVNLLVTGSHWLNEQTDPGWKVTVEGAIFDNHIEVANAEGLAVGDDISIAWDITPAFKREHNSSDYWYHTETGSRKTFFRRTVTAIEGNRVYFKVPLRYPVRLRDNPVLLRASHYAVENGVENLSLTNAVGVENAWHGFNQSTAILLRFCKDCWVRGVDSFSREEDGLHLRSHGISVNRSFRVTLADNHLQKPEHLGEGGNGYLFQLSQTNEVLIRDSSGRDGRHNFSINWDFGASGNVFLRIKSSGGQVCSTLEHQQNNNCSTGPSDFHHALALANLFDQVHINDALEVGNRQEWSLGAGQTGTLNVFWNVAGEGVVNAYNQGVGYVIGTGPAVDVNTSLELNSWPHRHIAPGTAPQDYTELLGKAPSLVPASLYEDQLQKRLQKLQVP